MRENNAKKKKGISTHLNETKTTFLSVNTNLPAPSNGMTDAWTTFKI